MNLRDLRYLVAVGEHRHFGRAAEACYVSQPTLSTQLKKLERELGVELVERTPGHVMLTAVGERIAGRARVMLDEAESIRSLARQAQDPRSGTVRMGLFPTLAPYLLPHVVPQIHERFPQLELLLVEEKTEVVLQQLATGRLDVGVLATPVDDRLHQEDLFAEDFLLAVPRTHPLASLDEPVDVGVLTGTHVLLLEEGHCMRDQALSVCRLTGAAEMAGFRATSLETLRQMVAAGVGVTLLPELAVRPPVPASDGVRLLRFAEPVPRRRIAMFWRETSVYGELLPEIAAVIRTAVTPLLGEAAIAPAP
ncbi:MAG TPA: LysR substrate-binding domain-containing protein [Iamia sp.]|nr:LysR substrate-binding domain-containing protein [Iamia sp.]